MSEVALIVVAIVLVPVVIGIGAGMIINPWGPWKDTFEVAAAGSGIVVALLVVGIVVVLITHPTECTHGHCNDTDNAAGVQVVFLAVLTPPIYALVLPGAAIGRLLGRGIRRRIHLSQAMRGSSR